uniref:Putative secreted peptide n=1 Tax=Hyalomma excavatum TaxID=257692 RepID=A0A131XPR1_9ACAR
MKTPAALILFAVCITTTGKPAAGAVLAPVYNTMCPVRYPFGVGNCTAFGATIPPGGSVALGSPCVLIECSSSGHRVTIEGCPDGKPKCTPSPTVPVPGDGPWPLCCQDCGLYKPTVTKPQP